LVLVAVAMALTVGVVLAAGAVAAAFTGWRIARRRSARVAAETHRRRLGELLAALVAELRAGADPRPAMVFAARGLTGLDRLAAAAAQPAGDVCRELDRLGRAPGGRSAADLAAAWALAELTGCGLAAPASRVLAAHRSDERLRRELAAQLAGTTATARLLAALPVAGVAMGAALGADPVGFLLGPGPGRFCLLGGAALIAVGVRWTRSITRSAAPSGAGP
jgi:tight adherence protein B